MPYSTSGVYTGPTGSTNATPGAVIRSATWNTINTDVATALTQVGQQMFSGPATVTAAAYTVSASVAAVIFNVSGTATVTLPSAATYQGYGLVFKTITNNAVVSDSSNVSPLTATTAGTAILVATIGKWISLKADGTNWVVMMQN